MRLYFRRHGWSNATLDEFLTCLEEASGRDLDEWAQLWLRTASLNTLAAEWHADGRPSRPPGDPPDGAGRSPDAAPACARGGTRARRVEGHDEIDSIPAWIDGPTRPTSPTRAATPSPSSSSRTTATTPTPRSRSTRDRSTSCAAASTRSTTRCCAQLLWMSMWEMVRDRELRSTEYLAIGRSELPDEPDLDILEHRARALRARDRPLRARGDARERGARTGSRQP